MNKLDLLEVNNLSVNFQTEYGLVNAVDDVSYTIKNGETLALVGESGSGKSVSAMALMRLTDITNGVISDGSIRFSNSNDDVVYIVTLKEDQLQKIRGNEISMIFQEPMTSLNPVLSIGVQISEAIQLHQNVNKSEAKNITLEMLKMVMIPDAEKQFNKYPHQFSGGMRQRVMIAMALSCRPKLLIADEPSTALDVTIQAQILKLIKNLQTQLGMAILFITHDMGVVSEISDRVIVMFDGKIVEEGLPQKIFHNPEHNYTKKLINSVPKLGSMKGVKQPKKFENIDLG